MTRGQAGWLLLLIAGICLVIIGWQGNLGVLVAILFSPSAVVTTEGGNTVGGLPGGSSTGSG